MEFKLDQRLEDTGFCVGDLDLCRVILVNNSLFPWIILVPKRPNTTEIIDLTHSEQAVLMQEIAKASTVIRTLFSPDKLNVAALGNVVPQLHVHIVARFKEDAAWPNTVFGYNTQKYSAPQAEKLIADLKKAFVL